MPWIDHCHDIHTIAICIIIEPRYHHYRPLWRPPDIQALALPRSRCPPQLILPGIPIPQYPNLLHSPSIITISFIQYAISRLNPGIPSRTIQKIIITWKLTWWIKNSCVLATTDFVFELKCRVVLGILYLHLCICAFFSMCILLIVLYLCICVFYSLCIFVFVS